MTQEFYEENMENNQLVTKDSENPTQQIQASVNLIVTSKPNTINSVLKNNQNITNIADKTKPGIVSANTIALNITKSADHGKSWIIALLLCIFLGYLGIHRFYPGYTTEGIIQLLTGGGCGIWALIDLIRIITRDLKPKNGDYID